METSQKKQVFEQAMGMEREAHELRGKGQIEPAFETYDKAAQLFAMIGEHLKAAFCYASAASCWNLRTGRQPLRNAATRSEYGAREALKAKNYEYALSLFRDASMLFEEEGDYERYSQCYYEAQLTMTRNAWSIASSRRTGLAGTLHQVRFRERVRALGKFLLGSISRFVWGYGERPFRTLGMAFLVILFSTAVYDHSGAVTTAGSLRPISFGEALYMAVITFTTVGYGDFVPVGWTRAVAGFEAFCGILLSPLFLVSLTRRYLRLSH